jgi:hypothetical protein
MPRFAHARSTPSGERRKTPRYQPGIILSALIGRHDAIVADLSLTGARVYHFAAVKRGETVRFSMHHGTRIFSSLARVLSSSVEALGAGPSGAPTYGSRLQFVDVSPNDQETLAELLVDLKERQTERFVRNAKGHYAPEPPLPRIGGYYMRLEWTGHGWREVATRDPRQPEEGGLTVPADTRLSERKLIRDAYERADQAGRHLIRLIAEAVCEFATLPS